MQRVIPLAAVALCSAFALSVALAESEGAQSAEQPASPADAFMKQLDTNGDGKVTLDEAKTPQASQFKENDKNGDGVITADEASEAFKARVPEEMLKAMQDRGMPDPGETFVKNLDKNGDGKVDQQEFEGPTAESFARMDKNGDGSASKDEAAAYFEDMKAQLEERMKQMQEQQKQEQK